EEYVVDLNGTQAAIRAGYSKRTANEQAARLLANVSVGEAVGAALKARSERTQIDADWVLKRLVEEAEADLADLYDENNHLKPVKDWPPIWRKGIAVGVETVTEWETLDGERKPAGVTTKVKVPDRIKRTELIGKHVNI